MDKLETPSNQEGSALAYIQRKSLKRKKTMSRPQEEEQQARQNTAKEMENPEKEVLFYH